MAFTLNITEVYLQKLIICDNTHTSYKKIIQINQFKMHVLNELNILKVQGRQKTRDISIQLIYKQGQI